jgi:hypothetical protein
MRRGAAVSAQVYCEAHAGAHDETVDCVWPGPRGRGRPPVGQRIHVHLPEEVLAAVDQLAADAELTRAEVIRGLLVAALATPADRLRTH